MARENRAQSAQTVPVRHIDPSADMADGIEPAPPPDRNPDGTVVIPPQRPETPPRPSLCRAGPCQHYHRFAIQIDAANPRAVRLPLAPPGALYQPPPVFHVETHHYCYPTIGVEMNLGALPVTECNRWDPPGKDGDRNARRERFWESAAGIEYREQVVAWDDARAAELAADAEAEALMAGSLPPAVAEAIREGPVAPRNHIPPPELSVDLRSRPRWRDVFRFGHVGRDPVDLPLESLRMRAWVLRCVEERHRRLSRGTPISERVKLDAALKEARAEIQTAEYIAAEIDHELVTDPTKDDVP